MKKEKIAKFLLKIREYGALAYEFSKEVIEEVKGTKKNRVLVIDPEETDRIIKQMEQNDLQVLSERVQDLEKAVYHMAGKQSKSLESSEVLEEIIIAVSTAVEELLNRTENGMSVSLDQEDEVEYPTPTNKKNITKLN